MGWMDLLEASTDETIVLPWLGGHVQARARAWRLVGPAPQEHGWYRFQLHGRRARVLGPVEAQTHVLRFLVQGYLVGDRLVADAVNAGLTLQQLTCYSEQVHLLEPGLDRFARIVAGRVCAEGPLVYPGQAMPLGPEEAVLQAFLDQAPTLATIKDVKPALDVAFRLEVHQRELATQRRQQLEEQRRHEEARQQQELARLQHEAQRKALVEQLGDGAGRRALAKVDFKEAARAALAVGAAELLDSRPGQRGEHVVRYRLDGQRFECICDDQLHIIDAGICLTDHHSGERGDTYFTLESLPAVIRQARHEDKLVVYRHF